MAKKTEVKAKKFSVGDVVVLNSGSPMMTVTDSDGNQVNVEWIDGLGKNSAWFPEVCLTKQEF